MRPVPGVNTPPSDARFVPRTRRRSPRSFATSTRHVGTDKTVLHRYRSIPAKAELKAWVVDGAENHRSMRRLNVRGPHPTRPWESSSSASLRPRATAGSAASCMRGGFAPTCRRCSNGGLVGASRRACRFWSGTGHERQSARKSVLVLRDADLSELDSLAEQKAREGFRLVALRDATVGASSTSSMWRRGTCRTTADRRSTTTVGAHDVRARASAMTAAVSSWRASCSCPGA